MIFKNVLTADFSQITYRPAGSSSAVAGILLVLGIRDGSIASIAVRINRRMEQQQASNERKQPMRRGFRQPLRSRQNDHALFNLYAHGRRGRTTRDHVLRAGSQAEIDCNSLPHRRGLRRTHSERRSLNRSRRETGSLQGIDMQGRGAMTVQQAFPHSSARLLSSNPPEETGRRAACAIFESKWSAAGLTVAPSLTHCHRFAPKSAE